MSFFYEIANRLGLGETSILNGYNLINYNGNAVYIEGLVKLLTVENNAIKAELKGAIALIEGENLSISELSDCLIIKGKITSTQFQEYKNTNKGGKNEKSNKK